MVSSWRFQLRITSPADPRLQEFVDKFQVSQAYIPEYGAPGTGGLGTPSAKITVDLPAPVLLRPGSGG